MGYNTLIGDVNNSAYLSGAVSVGTSAVEAKVGASRLEDREMVRIYNNSSQVVFYGASGVTVSTGEPIEPGASISLPAGDQIGVFLIVAAGTSDCRVQEMS